MAYDHFDIDLFISYSRQDNQPPEGQTKGRITELKEQIEAEYLEFAKEELRCFFDLDDIQGMDDWQHRILQCLRQSHLLLLVLSPAYIKSPYCQWEIVEYLKYEHARAVGGQGVAPVYFVEVPGLDSPEFEQEAAAWLRQMGKRNRIDLRPWYKEGMEALKRQDVRDRLDELKQTLRDRLVKLRRLSQAPGNIPAANPHFVGREEEMRRLHEAAGLGRLGVLTALQGMGGLGKTALALQYAHAYADFYPGGRWLLGCAGASELAPLLCRLEVDLGLTLSEAERKDADLGARRILAELERRALAGAEARKDDPKPPQPCALLLLDNVDHPDLLQTPQTDLLSGKPWLHVLATTRMSGEEMGAQEDQHLFLAVDELPLEDALRLIESHQPGNRFADAGERAAAGEIARFLGGFTLAVEVVALHLAERRGRLSCAALLERLRQEGPGGYEQLAASTKRSPRYRQKLISLTLGPTLDLLSAEENLVMAYAALLPQDSIPLPWLRQLVQTDFPQLGEEAQTGYDEPWIDLVNHLLGLRLLQVVDLDPESKLPRLVRLHRLAGELVRQRLGNEEATRRERLNSQLKSRCNELEQTWHLHQWEIPVLIGYAEGLLERGDGFAPKFLRALCQWLPGFDSGRHSVGLLRAGLRQLETDPGDDYTDLSVTLSNLSWALQRVENYIEAEQLLRRALTLDENHQPLNEHALAVRHANLSTCLMYQGKYAEAEPYSRKAYELAERILGKDHPLTLTALNNLASMYASIRDYKAAQPLFERALEARERILGTENPDTLLSINGLGVLLQQTSQLAIAEPLLRRSCAIRRKVHGNQHPATANGIVNLARLLHQLGQEDEAEALAKESIAMWQQTSVPQDSRSGKAYWTLGTIAANRGNTKQAREHLTEALRLLRLGHGETHPWVQEVQQALASLPQENTTR